jgi:hypothetical protein
MSDRNPHQSCLPFGELGESEDITMITEGKTVKELFHLGVDFL